jgi:alpha-L-fucosidase
MKNHDLSRRHFIKKTALFTSAAATLPMLPSFAADTNAPDPNALEAGASTAPPPPTASTVVLPPAPEPILPPPGFGVAAGPFQPTWESLAGGYQVPDWFRDAKFGIWAHWGPQCQPGMGDWYAQKMYQFNHPDYKYQCEHYGHPSKMGFKDVINSWKAEAWDPEHLISLYKRAGAKYFAALAHHHDNFDNFNSTYQPWNSVAVGPKRDMVGDWAKAVRNAGLRLALTSHGDRAWSWYQAAQGSDPSGPLAHVPYDGLMSKADGKGLWWEGLDPQDLYAQYHRTGKYGWPQTPQPGDPPLARPFIEKYFNRMIDLIDKYNPDLLYFDDSILPIYPSTDIGLRIAAYFYNTNIKRNGKLEAVITTKDLNAEQRRALVLDRERGVQEDIEALPWQTDTCIGNWHYQLSLFEQHKYKSAKQVTQMLVDIVSKNGNLQLSIPLPGSGMPDADELKFLEELTAWMDVNSEGIYSTRPWKIYGEGPSVTGPQERSRFGGARDVRSYADGDVRFTTKGDTLYAFIMAWPKTRSALIKSLATNSPQTDGRKVADVSLLGYGGKIEWTQTADGLTVKLPDTPPSASAVTLKIKGVLPA